MQQGIQRYTQTTYLCATPAATLSPPMQQIGKRTNCTAQIRYKISEINKMKERRIQSKLCARNNNFMRHVAVKQF